MKKTNTIFWISTALFAAFMIWTAIPDVMNNKEAVDFITNLGYPDYFVPFIGWMKILGSLAILLPLPMRLKEWAYAGLAFDLFGAIFSTITKFGFDPMMLTLLVPIGFGVVSYIYNFKRTSAAIA